MYLHRHEVVSIVVDSGKVVTASEANRLLGRTGESFWQLESYDQSSPGGGRRDESRRGTLKRAPRHHIPAKSEYVESTEAGGHRLSLSHHRAYGPVHGGSAG